MSFWKRFFLMAGALHTALLLNAQQPPAGGTQPQVRQRLNTVVDSKTGAPAESGTYDPLAFYRNNPELMKRYFPHLYQEMTNAPATGREPNPELAMRYGVRYPPPGPEQMVIPKITFPGGEEYELVEMLRKTLEPAPNILMSPGTGDRDIPPFELQNVTLPDLFQALNNMSDDKRFEWQLSGSNEPIWILKRIGFGWGEGIDPLTGAPIGQNIKREKTCIITPIGHFLTKYRIEDITTAVKTAWGMMGDDQGAEMKFHKDTELLIAAGTQEQLRILTQVLNSLETGARKSREEAARPSPVPETRVER